MIDTDLVSPSIVLEWETVRDAGIPRAKRALSVLRGQIAALKARIRDPAELIICYEETDIATGELERIVAGAAAPAAWPCEIRLIPVPTGTHYYTKKNIGAHASKNDVLIFLDSDVVPEEGWLEAMLGAFRDWSTSVIVGATALDHETAYEMAIALTWIFDPATRGRGIQPLRRYSSNNIAFRRALFIRFPFPEHGSYRGQCAQLQMALIAAGIPVREHTDARANHPPPAWFRGFLHRSWAAGRDEYYYDALAGRASMASGFRALARDYASMALRIRQRRGLLRPRRHGLMLGWLLGGTYYGLKLAAYLSSLARSARRAAPRRSNPGLLANEGLLD
jgi:glycosyltransferase involved in cell wall biosynthesis